MLDARPALAIALALVAGLGPAFAANTPKVKYIRIRESSTGEYRLEVTTTGTVGAAASVTVETEQGRTFTLTSAGLQRRASLAVAAGTPGAKGIFVSIELVDDAGEPLYWGSATLGRTLRGRWDGQYPEGREPGFWTGGVQAHPTATPGSYAFAFSLEGDGAARIAGGTLATEALNADGKPIVTITQFGAEAFTDERLFVAPVRFDGNPVGGSYALDVRVDGEGQRAGERTKATIEMVQLPGTDGAPGPVLGVTQGGYGNGYNPPAGQGQTQQSQLL
jgi:hypothetical protein